MEEVVLNKQFKIAGGVSLESVQEVEIGECELVETNAPNYIKVKGYSVALG